MRKWSGTSCTKAGMGRLRECAKELNTLVCKIKTSISWFEKLCETSKIIRAYKKYLSCTITILSILLHFYHVPLISMIMNCPCFSSPPCRNCQADKRLLKELEAPVVFGALGPRPLVAWAMLHRIQLLQLLLVPLFCPSKDLVKQRDRLGREREAECFPGRPRSRRCWSWLKLIKSWLRVD